MTRLQGYLTHALSDPLTTPAWQLLWHISDAILVRPGVNLRQLERAFSRLLRRHDTLRMHFVRKEDAWQARMFEAHPTGVTVTDHGEMERKDIVARVSAIAKTPIAIDAPALIQVHLLRFGAAGDAVVLHASHAICDGYGLAIMVEDLVKLLLRLPMGEAPLQHDAYMAQVHDRVPAHAGALAQYWDQVLEPVPPMARLGRLEKGAGAPVLRRRLATPAQFCTVRLDAAEQDRLTRFAAGQGASLYSMIVASLGEEIAARTGQDDILVSFVGSRTQGDLHNYVGPHISFPFLRCRQSDGATLPERAAGIAGQVRESFERTTQPFLWPDETEITARIEAEGGWAAQIMAHLGRADARAKASVAASILRSKSGEAMKLGPIEVTRIGFGNDAAALAELMTYIIPDEAGVNVMFAYDAEAYDADPLQEMLEACIARMRAAAKAG